MTEDYWAKVLKQAEGESTRDDPSTVELLDKLRSRQEEAYQQGQEEVSGNERESVPHYETPGGVECIDYLRSLGIAYEFSRGNAIKYLTRAGRKDGNSALGDLKKARTYIDFMIEELDV